MNPNSSPHFTVRVATLDDARKLSPMLSFIENEEITTEQVKARLETAALSETSFIAEMDGKPAGFAFLRLVPAISTAEPFAEITELYVQDLTQRETIGAKLTELLENHAREKGASTLHLLTGLRNTEAKNIYRALGYVDYALALRKRLK